MGNKKVESPTITPSWAPPDLLETLSKVARNLPPEQVALFERMATDPRMKEVWKWHAKASPHVTPRLMGTSWSLCSDAWSAMQLPGKPFNLSNGERRRYFEAVRKHSKALIDLLSGTMYDQAGYGPAIEDDELRDRVVSDLGQWWDVDEHCNHVVAYFVSDEGVHRLPWSYPESHLVDSLGDLMRWAHWGKDTSGPIKQTNAGNARVVYFTRTIYGKLQRWMTRIPFPVLATLTNVCLQLPAHRLVDADTVRKQVRRFHPVAPKEASKNAGGEEWDF